MTFISEDNKLPCGCEADGYGLWLASHDVETVTKGDKRWRKVTCDATGKWWKTPLPDLQEIDPN